MKTRDVFDALIIGGGLTGYASGILMSKQGMRVAVIEGFPWEWWLEGNGEDNRFLNYSGGIIYGVPGSRLITSLLVCLGIPLNNHREETGVSFTTLEPGFQVLQPKHWVNIFAGPEGFTDEMERVFPDSGSDLERLYQQSWKFNQSADNLEYSDAAGGQRHESALSRFLDGWTGYWNALFGRKNPVMEEALKDLDQDDLLGDYMSLFLFGLARRHRGESSVKDLYDYLELTAKPSSLINEKGQRGLFFCLKGLFQRIGGAVYAAENLPEFKSVRKEGISVSPDGKHELTAGWVVLDAPEREIPEIVNTWWPTRQKQALRPAVHMTLEIPWKHIPAGMGSHLVMNLDGLPDPLIATLAPLDEDIALMEILASQQGGVPKDGGVAIGAHLLERIRNLLRFLPTDLPQPVMRFGDFPSFYGWPGMIERLRFPSVMFNGPNIRRRGRCILVGRGDYKGSSLSGALLDGKDVAGWIMSRHRPKRLQNFLDR